MRELLIPWVTQRKLTISSARWRKRDSWTVKSTIQPGRPKIGSKGSSQWSTLTPMWRKKNFLWKKTTTKSFCRKKRPKDADSRSRWVSKERSSWISRTARCLCSRKSSDRSYVLPSILATMFKYEPKSSRKLVRTHWFHCLQKQSWPWRYVHSYKALSRLNDSFLT